MKSSVAIKVKRSEVIPQDGRVEWLEKWGVIPETIEIRAEAELSDWAQVAEILDDGTPNVGGWDRIHAVLATAIAAELREDPTRSGPSDVTAHLVSLAAKRAAEKESNARMEAEAERITAAAAAVDIETLVTETGGYSEAYSALEGAVREKLERNWRLKDLISERRAAHKAKIKAEMDAKAQAYVLAHPDIFEERLVRAAEERRFVRAAAIAAAKIIALEALETITGGPESAPDILADLPGTWEVDNRPPSAAAYMLRDELVAAIPSLEGSIPGAKVTVSDFGRGDVADEKKEIWRSMLDVQIWVEALGADVGAYVLLEPLDYDVAREDEEEE